MVLEAERGADMVVRAGKQCTGRIVGAEGVCTCKHWVRDCVGLHRYIGEC